MPSFEDLHLAPPIAVALERLGWTADTAALREAAPTAARGHNLVQVAPPAPAYAVPALAGMLSRLGQGRRGLLLAAEAHLAEWGSLAAALGGEVLRIQVARGTGRATRRLKAGEVDLLVATPETALALLRRSALGPESVASVFLAWPESWPDGESLAPFMQDLDKDAQRIVVTSSPERAADLVERYARRALTVGSPPPETARPAPAGPVRTVAVSWERRAAALSDLVEVMDPASVVVWTVDRSRHGDIARALPLGDPAVHLVTGDAPAAAAVVAFDLPTPERLRQLLTAGEVVLLVPPGTDTFVDRIASPRRPLRLPGAAETVASAHLSQVKRRAPATRSARAATSSGTSTAASSARAMSSTSSGSHGRRRCSSATTPRPWPGRSSISGPRLPRRRPRRHPRRSPPRRGSTSASGRKTAPR